MKRSLSVLLILGMLLSVGFTRQSCPDASASGQRTFTDSLGRTVELPAKIDGIAVSGPLAQVYVLPLAGDLLAGVSNSFAVGAKLYLPDSLLEKPELGQLYGGKGEMDLEALLAAAPDVVIDVGQPKDGMAAELDELTERTGIPFVHIDATLQTAPAAYRSLGLLLGRDEKAEALAAWSEDTLAAIDELMTRVDADGARKSVLYCLGDTGTNVLARGSYHAATVDMLTENAAVVDEIVSSGDGNEVDMEQILLWDPDVLLFAQDSVYEAAGQSAQWQSASAVRTGQYYRVPYGPYGWLSTPPAVQQYLGMLWLGALLYPDYVSYDLQTEVTEYYALFYGCELTDEMYGDLLAGALPE